MARLEVPGSLDGERLDRGIAMLTGLSRSQAARLVEAGLAWVAGKPVSSGSRRLRSGEMLEVPLTEIAPGPAATGPGNAGGSSVDRGGSSVDGGDEAPVLFADAPAGAGAGPGPTTRAEAVVVYADEDVVVVDKPAGLVVHPGAGNRSGTLVDQLLARFPDMAGAGPDVERPGIVHRLDKGTSGLLVVARTAPARTDLVGQMAARSAHRRYIALAHGDIAAAEGIIEAPLGRSPNQRVKMAVVSDGRFARTRYRVLRRTASPPVLTLVECRLETGRTHQVRVHLSAIGHPVFADDRYSSPALLREARKLAPDLHRPFLHAAELGFRHPRTGQDMRFTSPLPADLFAVLERLGLASALEP